MDWYGFECVAVREQVHQLGGLRGAIMRGECRFSLLLEDGDAFLPAAAVADGIVDLDALRL